MRFLNRNDDKAFDTEEHLSEEPLNQIGNKEILNINNLSPEEVAEKIRVCFATFFIIKLPFRFL